MVHGKALASTKDSGEVTLSISTEHGCDFGMFFLKNDHKTSVSMADNTKTRIPQVFLVPADLLLILTSYMNLHYRSIWYEMPICQSVKL